MVSNTASYIPESYDEMGGVANWMLTIGLASC